MGVYGRGTGEANASRDRRLAADNEIGFKTEIIVYPILQEINLVILNVF